MVLCPEMKYKYVSSGSLPQFHFTTECYLERKAWKCGIKMRNQSTTLTNIIASSGRRAAIASILNHTTTIHHLYELLGESLASTVNPNFQQRAIGNALILLIIVKRVIIKTHTLPSLISTRKSSWQRSMGVIHFTQYMYHMGNYNHAFLHSWWSYTHHAVGRHLMSYTDKTK